jgi:hypothetical protein
MAGLVLELQKDALEASVPITTLLRKALVVAKKLGIKEFQEWIQSELNGYDDFDNIPDYRRLYGDVKAWNPYHGYIPVIIQNESMSESLRIRKTKQPISELESLLDKSKESGILQMPFPPAVENELMKGTRSDLRPMLHISPNRIHGVLDIVRNTVLEWALKLEEEGILGEGLSFSVQEKEKAQANPNINIQNFQGILGNVSGSSVSQDLNMSIQMSDFKSLAEFLRAKDISAEDISELEKAIKDDHKPESPKSLGKRVSGWIGKMIAKAASGAWDIGVQAAGTILTNAISMYYGFKI